MRERVLICRDDRDGRCQVKLAEQSAEDTQRLLDQSTEVCTKLTSAFEKVDPVCLYLCSGVCMRPERCGMLHMEVSTACGR